MPSGPWHSGRRGACWGAHRLLQLGGFGLGCQRRYPEAGQHFVLVLVLARGASTGTGLGIIYRGQSRGVPILHLGKYLALGVPHPPANLLPLT